MLANEDKRLALLNRLSEVLGEEEARTLMECLPPVRWDQLATRDDIRASEERLRTEFNGQFALVNARFAEVHTCIDGLENKMDAGFAKVWAEFDSVRAELSQHRGEVAVQIAKLTRTMVFMMSGFMLTIWGTMLGIGLT